MRYAVVVLSIVLVEGGALAQNGVVLISQSTVAATGGNRSTGGFPYTITQPGSYQLSSNLTVSNPDISAIVIASNDVTLDLNGFRIAGPVVCSGIPAACSGLGNAEGTGVIGIGFSGITVINGSVRGMGGYGIYLDTGSIVDRIHADNNGNTGIGILEGIVRNSSSNSNAVDGISVNTGVISNSSASGNGQSGMVIADGSAYGNSTSSNGASGILITNGSAYGNSTTTNRGSGILAYCPSSLVNNTAFGNGANISLVTIGGTCALANNVAP